MPWPQKGENGRGTSNTDEEAVILPMIGCMIRLVLGTVSVYFLYAWDSLNVRWETKTESGRANNGVEHFLSCKSSEYIFACIAAFSPLKNLWSVSSCIV